mgnify:CR=1 FL=1
MATPELLTPFAVDWLPSRRELRRYDFAWNALREARAWGAEAVYTWVPQAALLKMAKLGAVHPRVAALDGDVQNSTYTEIFHKAFPDRFFQGFIAEQNMVAAAVGFSARGWTPFAATFACFLGRAFEAMANASAAVADLERGAGNLGAGVASYVLRKASSMLRETGPVTSSMSACLGEATK